MISASRIIELWDASPYGLVSDDRFHLMTGVAAHEVAVGPVHAGVIEPGHFRFQCMGEDVYNLEISLGYQHRGAERLIVEAKDDFRRLAIAQTVAGDTSIAASLACQAALGYSTSTAHCPLPTDHCSLPTAHCSLTTSQTLSRLLLELERIANHVGDLGALAGDVAYLPTASFCGRIRGEYLNMTAEFVGNRFGRSLMPLEASQDALKPKLEKVLPWFQRTRRECFHALDLLFSETSAIKRFEGTGRVSEADARAIGMVGVAARASGVTDTMGKWPVVGGGDVLARARQRYEELKVAHDLVERLLMQLVDSADDVTVDSGTVVEVVERGGDLFRVASVDAWRGQLVHAGRFVEGRLVDYRIFDPSFFNWFGLSLALRGEQISNFPICNKSFNLSYCGVDR